MGRCAASTTSVLAMPSRQVTRWYLEMKSRERLAAAPERDPELAVRGVELPAPEFARFLYTAVGGDWFWVDRLHWDFERWRAHVSRPEVELWVGWMRGAPVGYGELHRQGHDVLLAYFGLLPAFIGRGLGPRLLHAVVARAWEPGEARRVHLSTCSLDSPAALPTYLRTGFTVRTERVEHTSLPDEAPGPWAGARRATAARA